MTPWETPAIQDHVELVETVIAAGISAPPEWLALRDRMIAFLALTDSTPLRNEVVTAVVTGSADDDVPTMRALALAEAHYQAHRDTEHRRARSGVRALA